MSKMSKAVAVLGVVAGLGVAAMPLSTYAAANDAAETANLQINANVKGSIALTLTHDTGDKGTFTPATDSAAAILDLGTLMVNGPVQEGDVNAVVSSNGSRKIKLTLASSTAETAMKNTDASVTTNNTIPAITGAALTQGTAGWGYKVDGGAWTGIKANTDPATISAADDATSTTEATTPVVANKKNEKAYKVTFGAAADETVAEGTYTATVVFTATTND